MKQLYFFLLLFTSIDAISQVPASYTLLDNFNRNDSVKVGVPAGSTYEYWMEYGDGGSGCVSAQMVALRTNMMRLSNSDFAGNSCATFLNGKVSNIEMTFKYSTILANAAGELQWFFNMQQNSSDPTGFGSGKTGVSFVVACNLSNPSSGNPTGYAVVYGDATDNDRLRLVKFSGGFTTGTMTDIISIPGPVFKTNYMSIRVTFNPCNSQWSLKMRDDGAVSFGDPSSITASPGAGETAIDNSYTFMNLPWIGAILNHSGNVTVRYDNIYIPNGNTIGSYVWNGSVDTDFQKVSNWTPARTCVRPGDRLLFNTLSPAISTLTNVPTQTIRQLWISNNRTVILKDKTNDGIASTITITGAAGDDLKIENGSTLELDVTSTPPQDAMVINLNTGTTGNISGSLVFNNTGAAADNPHRLLAADANAITVASGGIIKALKVSGNPFGNSGTTNVIRFAAGSVYENHNGADVFGLPIPLSKVIFNTGSVYRHFSAVPPILYGRTYSHFESHGVTNFTTGATGSRFNTDNFTVAAGILTLSGSANNQEVSGNIKGDLTIAAGAIFNYDPVISSTVTFNSTQAAQHIYQSGNFNAGRLLTVEVNSNYFNPQLTVADDIALNGQLLITYGTLKLDGNIHLLSRATHTASVGKITGALVYGNGRFIVERYIPAHKAWRHLAVPVTTAQTINEAWQEGNAPLADNKPGYGTIITSNISGNGFDIYTPAGSSLKVYNSSSNAWDGVANTNVLPVTNKKGYMLMVRGDRSVTAYNHSATSTILRTTGKIFSPYDLPLHTTVQAGRFESVGNPYASAIDFNQVLKSGGVQNAFYVWDPLLAGSYGLGGYQSFQYNGTGYDVIPGGGSYISGNTNIESGQAFLALATGSNGDLLFTENCKVTGSNLVTRHSDEDELRVNLFINRNGQSLLVDGTKAAFAANNRNAIDDNDALKVPVGSESISIVTEGVPLVSERRSSVQVSDTIQYRIQGLATNNYKLQVVVRKMNDVNVYIIDRMTQARTVITSDTTMLDFSVDADPDSYNPERFYVVLNKIKNNNSVAHGISVYPNPVTHKQFTISFPEHLSGVYNIKVINSAGGVIHRENYTATGRINNIKINIQSDKPGLHTVRISNSNGEFSIPVMIL